jgi:O-antigen/teichoic acid export membrane protein
VRPRLSRLYAAGEFESYSAYTQQFLSGAAGIALVALALMLVFADRIVAFLYGSGFQDAGMVLRIHVVSAPFVFLGVAGSQWFVDRGLTRAVMTRSLAGAVLNVLLNLALIPSFGAVGSSIATLVAYATSGVLFNGVSRETRPLFWMQVRALRLRWPHTAAGHSG